MKSCRPITTWQRRMRAVPGDVSDTESKSISGPSVREAELKSRGQKVTSVCQSGDGEDEGGHQSGRKEAFPGLVGKQLTGSRKVEAGAVTEARVLVL